MAETETTSDPGMHWIGKLLAVLLTLAIVVVVFWQSRPGGSEGPSPDSSGNQGPDRSGDIEEVASDTYRAYAGQAFAMVQGKPAIDFDFRVRMFGGIDEDTRTLIRGYRTLIMDPNAPKYVGVSAEQMDKLKSIELPRMVMSDQDKEHFIELWHAWEKADAANKKTAQDAVLNDLRDLGTKSMEPTKQAWKDAGQTVKKTLTVQQLAKLGVYQETYGSAGFGGGFWGGGRGPASRRF